MSAQRNWTSDQGRHADTPKLTRAEAEKRGLAVYWTGTPCKRGHINFRYVCSCMCTACKQDFTHRRNQEKAFGTDAEKQANARRKAEELREKLALEKELNDDFGGPL